MTEKSKWFDKREPVQTLPVIPGMRDTSFVTAEQIRKFLHELFFSTSSGNLTRVTFSKLGAMKADDRLARNLSVVLDILRNGNTGTSLRDIVTDVECEHLMQLPKSNISKESQLVAYCLLNINERLQAKTTMRTAFISVKKYRDECATWEQPSQ